MGTDIASSARAMTPSGRPQASFPKSHAVGPLRSPRRLSSYRSPGALADAASTRRPASRSAVTAGATGTPVTSGRWKMLPADARTHLLLYGSTDASEKITPSAPAASAVRSMVPALPGSRTLASSATSRGCAVTSASRLTSRNRQVARRPWGVMVCASSAITSPLTRCTGMPRAAGSLPGSLDPGRAYARDLGAQPGSGIHDQAGRSRAPGGCLAGRGPGPAPGSGHRGIGTGLAKVGGQRLTGDVDQGREGRCVGHRKLGEHPPVHLDTGDLQALDEPVVGDPLSPRRGVDALDPQPPERSLAVLAVTVGIGHRVERLLLCLPVQPGPLAPVATRPLKDDPALLVGVDRPLHACHVLPTPSSGPGHLPSSLFIFCVSAGDSSTSASRRRVRVEGLCSNRWLRLARRRMILPVPVSRNRLLAPL